MAGKTIVVDWKEYDKKNTYLTVRDEIQFKKEKAKLYSQTDEIKVINLPEPELETYGPWNIVIKARKMAIVVYDKKGIFKEVVIRTTYPKTPFGPWAVWAFWYKGKKYTSLVDDIDGYLTVDLSKEKEVINGFNTK